MKDDRLSLLVSHYLDGQLAPDELAELESLLRGSAALRDQFWSETRLHSMLYEAEEVQAHQVRPQRHLARVRRFGLLAALIAAAACAVIIPLMITWNRPRQTQNKGPSIGATETTAKAVALLTRSLNVEWKDAADNHAVGKTIEPGWLRLKSGLAYVEFFNGVGMVLEGPTEVQLLSVRKVNCRSGRVNVEVPTVARGFTVCTPRLQVVDIGTAFGVHVTDRQEEVHVFKGQVTYQVGSTAPRALNQGEAVAITGDGMPQFMTARQEKFMSAAELERKSDAAQGNQLQAWRAASARTNADPSLLVHFDFGRGSISGRTLRNLAPQEQARGDATVVGCVHADGRWAGKDALEFGGLGDRVRIHVPGEYRDLTLVTWIRIDRLECLFNSLFMSDAFEPGALHWQIRRNGRLHVAISGPEHESAANYNFDSPGIFTSEKLGRWTQLAMVYDGAHRLLTQYVDGQPICRSPIINPLRIRIGHGELGNWNPGTHTTDPTPVRYLSGRMDEFFLFDRALSDQEILNMDPSISPALEPENE